MISLGVVAVWIPTLLNVAPNEVCFPSIRYSLCLRFKTMAPRNESNIVFPAPLGEIKSIWQDSDIKDQNTLLYKGMSL